MSAERRLEVALRRDQPEPVGDQDEQEQRQGQRHDERGHLAHARLDLLLDRVDDGLEGELQLARPSAGRPAGHVEASAQHDQARDDARHDRVDVEREADDLAVWWWPTSMSAASTVPVPLMRAAPGGRDRRTTVTMISIWKVARPMNTIQPLRLVRERDQEGEHGDDRPGA